MPPAPAPTPTPARPPVPVPTGWDEQLGFALGGLLAPWFALSALLRTGRPLHPRGICVLTRVTPRPETPPRWQALARRLSGDALMRFSAGLWWREQRLLPDLLGCAIRFQATPPWEQPGPDAQDLLLATAHAPWSFLLDGFRTRQDSFLHNLYYGISPFVADGARDVLLRLSPRPWSSPGENRYERLRHALAEGMAHMRLELQTPEEPRTWQPLVDIQLQREVQVDGERLRFWPFRAQLGIVPQGFVQYLRPLPYAVSQFVRGKLHGKEVAASGPPAPDRARRSAPASSQPWPEEPSSQASEPQSPPQAQAQTQEPI